VETDVTFPGIWMIAPDELVGHAPIVVLAPHPDDESLGCGALLAHAFAHDGAHVICMTDGSASHPGSRDWPPARLAAERRRELILAIARLGGAETDVTWLGRPDGWLGAQDAGPMVATIADTCRSLGARRLFAPAREDRHEDHRTTARIASRVACEVPGLSVVSYPLWSRWDEPDLLTRVSRRGPVIFDPIPWRAVKRSAIEAHATQLGLTVRDDPEGFTMPPGFVDHFVEKPEIYWKAPE
jgi:LmbE family N-acetylglucosaminyl deacetylase